MSKNLHLILRLSAALILPLVSSVLFAQDALNLGPAQNELLFQGTGTGTLNAIWQHCASEGCVLEGPGSRGNEVQGAGTYRFSAPVAKPFRLVSTAFGRFDVDQTSPIAFRYDSPHGTVIGHAHFTSVVQDPYRMGAILNGTLEVTGGTYQSYFASGQGVISLTLAVGKKNLSTLVDSTLSMNGQIDFPSTISPPASCGAASIIPAALTGATVAGGQTVWFSANFSATGIQNGTYLQFERALIQFQANGKPYLLHVPNAVVTFSNSATCASTSFDESTNTWESTVPLSDADEVFLSGVPFTVSAPGLPSGTVVSWSQSFASNSPDVAIQWKWGATVLPLLSSDYNALGIKPTRHSACLTKNDDPAGTPEKYVNAMEGGSQAAGARSLPSWSATARAKTNCP